jgi:hypothetical protein
MYRYVSVVIKEPTRGPRLVHLALQAKYGGLKQYLQKQQDLNQRPIVVLRPFYQLSYLIYNEI